MAGPDVKPAAMAGSHPAGLAAGLQSLAGQLLMDTDSDSTHSPHQLQGAVRARTAFSRALSKCVGHRPGLETCPGWGAVTVWRDRPMAEVPGGCGSYTFPAAHPVPNPAGALACSAENFLKKPSGWQPLEERPVTGPGRCPPQPRL